VNDLLGNKHDSRKRSDIGVRYQRGIKELLSKRPQAQRVYMKIYLYLIYSEHRKSFNQITTTLVSKLKHTHKTHHQQSSSINT
jgi:hypothetical protein